jgi:sec-independent protein translocase protein TatB
MFDFGVGYSELFVLAVIAVIVIGPKDLPRVLRTFGQFMNKARGMAREFQGHVDAAMRDTGMDTLKKDVQDLRKSVDVTAQKSFAPNLPALGEAVASSGVRRDFESYFGPEAKAGETRVAGSLVMVETPSGSAKP